jgi:hypothetical protein
LNVVTPIMIEKNISALDGIYIANRGA